MYQLLHQQSVAVAPQISTTLKQTAIYIVVKMQVHTDSKGIKHVSTETKEPNMFIMNKQNNSEALINIDANQPILACMCVCVCFSSVILLDITPCWSYSKS